MNMKQATLSSVCLFVCLFVCLRRLFSIRIQIDPRGTEREYFKKNISNVVRCFSRSFSAFKKGIVYANKSF